MKQLTKADVKYVLYYENEKDHPEHFAIIELSRLREVVEGLKKRYNEKVIFGNNKDLIIIELNKAFGKALEEEK